MKIDKIEYKRVINGAGHLEYDLLQYLEKNRATAAQNLKQSEIDRIIQHARKSFFGDTIVLKDEYAEDYLLLKKYTDMFQESF